MTWSVRLLDVDDRRSTQGSLAVIERVILRRVDDFELPDSELNAQQILLTAQRTIDLASRSPLT